MGLLPSRIERRLVLSTLVICVAFSLVAAHAIYISERDSVLEESTARLARIVRRHTAGIRDTFARKQEIGQAANAAVGRFLRSGHAVPRPAGLTRDAEGAVRAASASGLSGFFAARETPLSAAVEQFAAATEEVWEVLAPVMMEDFFNFYIITTDQCIRIAPPDWALKIESDHDFRQDIFFQPAEPEQNPDGLPVWTRVYYDSIWHNWMTSLLVPLYRDGRFIGITGGDFILDRIFSDLARLSATEGLGAACLFDDAGNIVVHPDYMDDIRERSDAMNAPLSFREVDQAGLVRVISDYLEGEKDPSRVEYEEAGAVRLAYLQPVNLLHWNIAVYVDAEEMMGELAALRWKIVAAAVGIALVLVLVLRAGFKRLVLTRLLGLERATHDLAGERDPVYPAPGNDEIGDLVRAVRSMVDSLKEKELNLQTKTDELQAILDNAVASIHLKDPDGRYLLVNRSYERLLRRPRRDIVGRTDADLFAPEFAESLVRQDRRVIAEGAAVTEEQTLALDGSDRTFLAVRFPLTRRDGTVYGICCMSTDVTERKRAVEEHQKLREQIKESQRLESLGVLAGGIAHDFNNLLVGILGNASQILDSAPPDSETHVLAAAIDRSAERAAELCAQMLAYSGKGRFMVEPIDLNAMVKEMIQLLEASVSKKAELRFLLARELPAVEADATQIRQVIMNLVTNASEALQEESGTITFETGLAERDQEDATRARYVYLRVSDTGCGMDEATRKQIFEPFFTTKFAGRGLGMSAVQGIVRGHGGAIEVDSEPGRGTSFSLYLPAAERPAVTPRTPPAVGAEEPVAGGTVLVVDDDEMVREVARRLLEKRGYTVLLARDGLEGVALFKERREDLDCVILDLMMPRMDGVEAFREMHRLRGDVPILLSSGYSKQDAAARFAGGGLAGFIQKPYHAAALAAAVQVAIAERQRQPS